MGAPPTREMKLRDYIIKQKEEMLKTVAKHGRGRSSVEFLVYGRGSNNLLTRNCCFREAGESTADGRI